MKHFVAIILVWFLCKPVFSDVQVERWDRFEVSYYAQVKGNPFDVELTATFSHADTSFTVSGFYDGENKYVIRFMPPLEGKWRYVTRSDVKSLNKRSGTLECIAPSPGNHGPVVPDCIAF